MLFGLDDEDIKYEGEDDEVKKIFDDEIEELDDEDEDNIAPQNKPEYQVKSQIINGIIDGLKPQNIVTEMGDSFLAYAMSVIVSRALPDARDGLKPVHRRILYSMGTEGLSSTAKYAKCAKIVGDVMGKYHPHGDLSIYEAVVRMAQNFSLRYPLIDGHGNFGSIDGDSAAAFRYTEARMSKLAEYMLEGIKKNTVNFVPNYDGQLLEPTVLPARFPNLLISGASGIAVGVATSIPPHNLNEVIDAVIALAKNPDITVAQLRQYVKGPDFPTGGELLDIHELDDAYETGRGRVTIRSKYHIERLKNGKSRIVVTEIPYEVKKPKVREVLVDLIKDGRIKGIDDARDETSRGGIRFVIEVKKDFVPEVVMNKILKHTALQIRFSYNMVAIVNGEPKLVNLKQMLQVYLDHQIEVVTRRIKFDLDKDEKRLHILYGLKIAINNIDQVINIVRSAANENEAKEKIQAALELSVEQAEAVVEMRLGRLTGLSIENMNEEITAVQGRIEEYYRLLNNHDQLINLIINDLEEIKAKFGDARRSEIKYNVFSNITDEDLIPQKEIIITLSHNGYIKRIPLEEYKAQKRGGVGTTGAKTNEDDMVKSIFATNTHIDLLAFSSYGKVYRIRALEIPEESKVSKGTPFINIIKSLEKDEKIVSLLPIKHYEKDTFLVFATKNGIIKKTAIDHFIRINNNGKKAIIINENDELISVFITNDSQEILIGNSNGRIVRFNSSELRPLGRSSMGVIGIKIDQENNERVISATSCDSNSLIFALGDNGYGKMSDLDDYRKTSRGKKGVLTINVAKAGSLVYFGAVKGNEEILIITSGGLTIRTNLEQVNTTGRNAKGVKIITIKDNDVIKSVSSISQVEEDHTLESTSSNNSNDQTKNQDSNDNTNNESTNDDSNATEQNQ